MTERNDIAAVVLAAGAGTRLRPLTFQRPKALCPVGNVPLVDRAISRASRVTSAIAVNTHHGREMLAAHLDGRVHVSIEEDEVLGTAGALGALRDWIDGRPTLVLNADAWHDDDLSALLDGADGTRGRLLVVEDAARGDFGRWRYAGAALLPWDVVAGLQAEPSGLYRLAFEPLRGGGRLDLVPSEGAFFDCGTPVDYHAANMHVSSGANVVGQGAVVEGRIERSVVWPGARVEAGEHLVDAIRALDGVTVRL